MGDALALKTSMTSISHFQRELISFLNIIQEIRSYFCFILNISAVTYDREAAGGNKTWYGHTLQEKYLYMIKRQGSSFA